MRKGKLRCVSGMTRARTNPIAVLNLMFPEDTKPYAWLTRRMSMSRMAKLAIVQGYLSNIFLIGHAIGCLSCLEPILQRRACGQEVGGIELGPSRLYCIDLKDLCNI